MSKKLQKLILTCILLAGIFSGIITTHASEASQEDPIVGYLTRENPKTRSVSNAYNIPIQSTPYETFWTNNSIMYIKDDDANPDSLGKWRLVYCLDWGKKSPSGNMSFSGWENKKVSYALYYGCVYWGETCRYAPYSTGDWKLDYTATQAAIWVLSGQFSLDYACSYLIDSCSGPATAQQKALVISSCQKIVNDANNENYYKAWTSDGWFDLSLKDKTTFDVTGYQDTWTNTNDGYYRSGGTFSVTFESYYNYDMRSQITLMDIQVPDGVGIRKSNNSTFSDFNLYIAEAQFLQWQKTGKDIPVTVTITLPRQWGAGIYAPSDSNFQQVTFFTYQSQSDSVSFTKTITLHIPQTEPDPTPEPTPEPTQTPEPTPDPTPEPTSTPKPTPEPTPTPTPTPKPTPEPTPTPTPTPEPTPEPTPTPTPEPETLRSLTIHKVIYQDDLWWAHGEPTFLFEVSGTDTSGKSHTYHRALTFTRDYAEANVNSDGTIMLTTTIDQIPSGTYSLEEQKVSRFALTDVTAQTSNIRIFKIKTDKVYAGISPIKAYITANLMNYDGEITFFNRKITWDEYSHRDVAVNQFTLKL